MLTTNERGDVMGYNWQMKKCPVCGKEFLPAGQHSYKIGNAETTEKLVCTYTCQRKWEREQEEKQNRKKMRKGKLIKIVETGETFKSVVECANRLNVEPTELYQCINRGIAYNGYHIERVR
jgi:DNA repair exonuclease SbcCD ATPase subunit